MHTRLGCFLKNKNLTTVAEVIWRTILKTYRQANPQLVLCCSTIYLLLPEYCHKHMTTLRSSVYYNSNTVLQQVLSGQRSLEKRKDHVESEILCLQSNLDAFRESTQSSSGDSGSDRKRKRVVTRDLSVSIIHCVL